MLDMKILWAYQECLSLRKCQVVHLVRVDRVVQNFLLVRVDLVGRMVQLRQVVQGSQVLLSIQADPMVQVGRLLHGGFVLQPVVVPSAQVVRVDREGQVDQHHLWGQEDQIVQVDHSRAHP